MTCLSASQRIAKAGKKKTFKRRHGTVKHTQIFREVHKQVPRARSTHSHTEHQRLRGEWRVREQPRESSCRRRSNHVVEQQSTLGFILPRKLQVCVWDLRSSQAMSLPRAQTIGRRTFIERLPVSTSTALTKALEVGHCNRSVKRHKNKGMATSNESKIPRACRRD